MDKLNSFFNHYIVRYFIAVIFLLVGIFAKGNMIVDILAFCLQCIGWFLICIAFKTAYGKKEE